jgi:hypothetical protein
MKTNIVLLFIIPTLGFTACKKPKKTIPYAATVLHYLQNRPLRADSFTKQLWQLPIDYLGLDPKEKEVYFLYPRYGYTRAQVLNKLCQDTADVFFPPCDAGMCQFGSMEGNVDSIVPFRMPLSNLKFDPNIILHTKLKKYTYNISLKELEKIQDSTMYYNTPNTMQLSNVLDVDVQCSNIGSYISKKGDTLLTNWAKKITQNCTTNEQKAQALLEFVTNEIDYSYADYWYDMEIVRNAHEVIMTGLADCSGKSTLFASLLEQLGIPYCLLYYYKHMNVGVVGNFTNINNYTIEINKVQYHVAETTIPNFKIGTSQTNDIDFKKELILYQVPNKSNQVINSKTKTPIRLVWDY